MSVLGNMSMLLERLAPSTPQYAKDRSGKANMARVKAFDLASTCEPLRFRIKELKHLLKKSDNSMAAHVVQNMSKSAEELCKNSARLRDMMRKAGSSKQ
jgi:hypothetical protein